MKKLLNIIVILSLSSALLACSGQNENPANDTPVTETIVTDVTMPATENTVADVTIPATENTVADVTTPAIPAMETSGPKLPSAADYIPLYENAVYVYEIQSEETGFNTIEYKVRMDFIKTIDDVTAAQFTRFNDEFVLFSYLLLHENDNIYFIQTSFDSADELTLAAIKAAKDQKPIRSLINQPINEPHQWENWSTRATFEGDTKQLRNWMTVSQIDNPVVPVNTLLGSKDALEVIEYHEEQTYNKCYYIPQVGLIRTDSVLDENTVISSDVLIRIENFNRDFEGNYYETLNINPSKITS